MAEIDSNVKLYVKEEADKARAHVLTLFTIIASIIALITGIGVYLGTQANIKQAMQDGDFARLLQESEQKNSEINTLYQEAEALVKEIQQSQHLRIQTGECIVSGENHSLVNLTGEEVRTHKEKIIFPEGSFNTMPKIVVGIAEIGGNVTGDRAITFKVSEENITLEGFTCRTDVWANTVLGIVRARWIAYGH